jgi:hypothetical protein
LAAVDQITFEIPENVFGCSVSLTAEVAGRTSNWTILSVAADGKVCPEMGLLPSSDLARIAEGAPVTGASFNLLRFALTVTLPGLGGLSVTLDFGSANFQRLPAENLSSAFGLPPVSPGSCMVIPGQLLNVNFTTSADTPPSIPLLNGLDAGPSIRISGPKGERRIKPAQPGSYSDTIGQSIPGLLEDAFLNPGPYTIDNGDGAADVGPFSISLNVTGPPAWINASEVNTVARTQDLNLAWSTANSSAAISIIGFSSGASGAVGSFQCFPRPGDDHFTVPASVLRALPPSRPAALPDVSGALLISAVEAGRAEIPGLDVAATVGGTLTGKTVNYQ